MTFFIGLDVCKSKLDVSCINEQGIELWYDVVPNESEELLSFLLSVQYGYDLVATAASSKEDIVCVVESTGSYHYTLLDVTTALDITCRLLNPIVTKQQIKATIRGKKTDRTDATMIARMGLRGEGRIYTPEPYVSAKVLVRSMQKLEKLKGSFRLHNRHLSGQMARSGDALSETAVELLQNIDDAIVNAKKQLYIELQTSLNGDIFTLLQTIPGVGPYIASSIIGEIQTMDRFKTAKCLVAYSGLDPNIKQSGHTLNSTGHITKRGSSYLRRNLFLAANVSRIHDEYFRSFYDKKRSEGKSHREALTAISRKLLAVVRSVWLSGRGYDVKIAMKG